MSLYIEPKSFHYVQCSSNNCNLQYLVIGLKSSIDLTIFDGTTVLCCESMLSSSSSSISLYNDWSLVVMITSASVSDIMFSYLLNTRYSSYFNHAIPYLKELIEEKLNEI